MKYLAVLGRQAEISVAELGALFLDVKRIGPQLAEFSSKKPPEIDRLGGTLKIAQKIEGEVLDYLQKLPPGKITFGVSDYSKKASKKTAGQEALKLKKILVRHGRSVRILQNTNATLSTATAFHNKIGQNERKLELLKVGRDWYSVIGVQNIEAYTHRDQKRPARDAKVGMLPPKLAQILINLCGDLPDGARILDPFCGTGVVLQEALLMGYEAYGTDLEPRMVAYAQKNLKWLDQQRHQREFNFQVEQGDATNYQWPIKIDAVACEIYLGPPMSAPPTEIKLTEAKQTCGAILIGFLRNLSSQVGAGTPVTLAIPAWLRPDGRYSRLGLLDEIEKLSYNVEKNASQEDLLYFRDGQIVAREIISLRKK